MKSRSGRYTMKPGQGIHIGSTVDLAEQAIFRIFERARVVVLVFDAELFVTDEIHIPIDVVDD